MSNGIESVWAVFKRLNVGGYHQVGKKHLPCRSKELIALFNTRSISSIEEIGAEGPWMLGERLRYRKLLG